MIDVSMWTFHNPSQSCTENGSVNVFRALVNPWVGSTISKNELATEKKEADQERIVMIWCLITMEKIVSDLSVRMRIEDHHDQMIIARDIDMMKKIVNATDIVMMMTGSGIDVMMTMTGSDTGVTMTMTEDIIGVMRVTDVDTGLLIGQITEGGIK